MDRFRLNPDTIFFGEEWGSTAQTDAKLVLFHSGPKRELRFGNPNVWVVTKKIKKENKEL